MIGLVMAIILLCRMGMSRMVCRCRARRDEGEVKEAREGEGVNVVFCRVSELDH